MHIAVTVAILVFVSSYLTADTIKYQSQKGEHTAEQPHYYLAHAIHDSQDTKLIFPGCSFCLASILVQT